METTSRCKEDDDGAERSFSTLITVNLRQLYVRKLTVSLSTVHRCAKYSLSLLIYTRLHHEVIQYEAPAVTLASLQLEEHLVAEGAFEGRDIEPGALEELVELLDTISIPCSELNTAVTMLQLVLLVHCADKKGMREIHIHSTIV